MKIPVSSGTQVGAQPIMQQHTPMTGLSQIGRTLETIHNQRDEKQRKEEAQQKAIALYHDRIAEQEGQLKVDDVLTTEMSEQVTLLKNDVANGAMSADDANKKLNEWSEQRYKQLETDLPLHAREQYQNHWKRNVQQQSTSMLPLQLRADAQKGLTLAEQAFGIATRYDEAKGAEYLDLYLDKANVPENTKSELRHNYKKTRNLMSIDERMNNAIDSKDTAVLDQLLTDMDKGGFGYLDGPTLQQKRAQVLSRKDALNKQIEVEENKRVQLAGKAFNDFKSQVFTGYELSDDLIGSVRGAVAGTEHEQEFEFYVQQSSNIQSFKRMSTSDQKRLINQQRERMANGQHADPVAEEKLLSAYESVHQDKLNTIKENPSQAVREAGLNIHPLPAGEMHMNPKSWAAKAVENGVSQSALKDSNIKLLPIPAEDLPDAKKAFNEAGVQGKLAIISNLIGESKGVKNGAAIWGSALGQLGGGDQAYIMAGVAHMNGYKSDKGEDVATAILSGTQALKNKQIIMPKEDLLKTKFNDYVGNTVSGSTANMTYASFKALYAHVMERDGTQQGTNESIESGTAKTALSLATGGVYEQDVKHNKKAWKVSKPYGMADERFESHIQKGYDTISKNTGIPVAELETLRLRRSDRLSPKGEIQYDLVNERGNPLVSKGAQWRINLSGVTK
ncbi:methyl-coenzyme M reductase [Acinetobacter sp.]|uniref:methyl-coenzyme M reductase n=1 Tax=Acinetobacter sp. TaxID=472 RepID=UPI0038903734